MLAAGVGRRLGDESLPPKVLLRFGGESLLARHLAILSHCGIARIDICVGYRAGEIASELARLAGGNDVASHMNPEFGNGSILSLRTLKDVFTAGDTVIFMDGDVLCDYRMMERLVAAGPANCFLMDRRVRPGDDPVRLCLRDGRLIDIHKRPTIAHDRAGEWIGFARFTPAAAAEIAAAADRIVDAGRIGAIYEEAFRQVLLSAPPGTFGVEDVTGLPWVEIDFPEDLDAAHAIFPALERLPR